VFPFLDMLETELLKREFQLNWLKLLVLDHGGESCRDQYALDVVIVLLTARCGFQIRI